MQLAQAANRHVGRQVPGRKHKILVEYWLMLVICKHDNGFDCASCDITNTVS
jgi:hypothetical protein